MRVEPGATATVEVPASSANLGPGFDALALALSLRLRVTVEALPEGPSTLEVSGEGAGRLRVDGSNRFFAALERALDEADVEPAAHWRARMDNEIPLARGLGSSAAAAVAGILAAEALAGAELGSRRLALATEIEGHPDNAAAALLGGFVVVAGGRAARFEPPSDLRAVVFVPEVELSTERMRAALPRNVPHHDAARNLGQTAMVVAAFATGDLSLLAAMYADRLHEPYRAEAFPALARLVEAARDAGAAGAALSGAGSSVIALCDGDSAAQAVAAAWGDLELALAGATRMLRPATRGAAVA